MPTPWLQEAMLYSLKMKRVFRLLCSPRFIITFIIMHWIGKLTGLFYNSHHNFFSLDTVIFMMVWIPVYIVVVFIIKKVSEQREIKKLTV
jgi:hypothetical protein